VKALIKRDSKRYAKRQQTFFQSFPNVRRIDMTDPQSERRIAEILLDIF